MVSVECNYPHVMGSTHSRCTNMPFHLPSLPLLYSLPSVPSEIPTDIITVHEGSDVVTWSPPPNPGGPILYYELRITQDGNVVITVTPVMSTTIDINSLNLESGQYEIQVIIHVYVYIFTPFRSLCDFESEQRSLCLLQT